MLLDIVVLMILCYVSIVGFRRGLWLSSIHALSTFASLWIAQQFYREIAQRLIVFLPFPKTVAFDTQYAIHFNHLQYRFESIIAFIVIAISCKLILYLIIVTFDNIVAYQPLNIISRVLGIVLSLLMGVIIIQILTYLIALYPNAMLQGQLGHSLLAKQILLHTPYVSRIILNL
ncbi:MULTISPECIES: CvpA family protein [Staphylococcus]|mgnify:CR=1 FL=1|uniref:CvpA family protein n=1 Tax=Staphylococcus TaxID=1279 RepID=UPI000246436D|nr:MULTISPECIES: CvpA family protein [Staphylococcus]QAV31505.1 colicin V production protein CvpA [Sulfitobacter donghicola]AGZ26484.1 CvpA family protein [Staphylococcus pasteuri SP1]KAB7647128.1 CvpA family protein [Staphylococcus sp. B2-b]MBN6852029.1 CvpA family protein [Staphylococcus warneri]MBT2769119.1 CvpA family protein [Staphylococcus warneri]